MAFQISNPVNGEQWFWSAYKLKQKLLFVIVMKYLCQCWSAGDAILFHLYTLPLLCIITLNIFTECRSFGK